MSQPDDFEDWKVTEQLAVPLMVDGVLLYVIYWSHRAQDHLYAWQVLDEHGREGWAEFEHHSPTTEIGGVIKLEVPDLGSVGDRLVGRLRGLRKAIEDWRDRIKSNLDPRYRGA